MPLRYGVRSVRLVVLMLSLVSLGCAAIANTPAQDLAWERWKKCDRFPTISLKEIRTNGEIWVWTQFGSDLNAWGECDKAAWEEQRRAGKTATAQPVASAIDTRELIRFAYFTDSPPQSGTFLRSSFWRNMPPEVKQFNSDSPVSFFYGLTQVGRVLKIQGNWIGPDGRSRRVVERTMNQMGQQGSWTWQTQTLGPSELNDTGVWTVELVIEGQPVGRYSFTRGTDGGGSGSQ